jgi:hypothetical protein
MWGGLVVAESHSDPSADAMTEQPDSLGKVSFEDQTEGASGGQLVDLSLQLAAQDRLLDAVEQDI